MYILSILLIIILPPTFILLIDSLFLQLITKIFKIKEVKYKISFIVAMFYSLSAFVINLILFLLFPLSYFPSSSEFIRIFNILLTIIIGFVILNKFYKKNYQNDVKKNLILYIGFYICLVLVNFLVILSNNLIFKTPHYDIIVKEDGLNKNGDYKLLNLFDKNYQYEKIRELLKNRVFIIQDLIDELEYSDAGKKCINSNQCHGLCVTNIISNLGKEGECQKVRTLNGCWNAIENKEFLCFIDDMAFECNEQSTEDGFCKYFYEKGLFFK